MGLIFDNHNRRSWATRSWGYLGNNPPAIEVHRGRLKRVHARLRRAMALRAPVRTHSQGNV